jgi:Immunoglobulin I-set domain
LQVKWLFNDAPVSGRDFLVSTSGQRQVLSIPEVNPSLVGKYSCVAENEVGKATSTAELMVEGVFKIILIFWLTYTCHFLDVPDNIMESSFSLDKQESLESFSVRRSVFAQSSSSFSTSLGGETHGISTHSLQTMHQNGNQAPIKVHNCVYKSAQNFTQNWISVTNAESWGNPPSQSSCNHVPQEKKINGSAFHYSSQWKNCRPRHWYFVGGNHWW